MTRSFQELTMMSTYAMRSSTALKFRMQCEYDLWIKKPTPRVGSLCPEPAKMWLSSLVFHSSRRCIRHVSLIVMTCHGVSSRSLVNSSMESSLHKLRAFLWITMKSCWLCGDGGGVGFGAGEAGGSSDCCGSCGSCGGSCG